MMEKDNNIFEVLTNIATGERLDATLFGDAAYQKARNEVDGISAQVKGYGFTEGEMQMIDGLVCAYISQGICCMKAAYRQGFKDCACLLGEMGLVK